MNKLIIVLLIVSTLIGCGNDIESTVRNEANALNQEWTATGRRLGFVALYAPMVASAAKKQIIIYQSPKSLPNDTAGYKDYPIVLKKYQALCDSLQRLNARYQSIKTDYVSERTAFNAFLNDMQSGKLSNTDARIALLEHHRNCKKFTAESQNIHIQLQKLAKKHDAFSYQLAGYTSEVDYYQIKMPETIIE